MCGRIYSPLVLFKLKNAWLTVLKNPRVRGVVFDISDLSILDTTEAQILLDTIHVMQISGALVVITGMRPGIVAALVDRDFDFGNTAVVHKIDDGFTFLREHLSKDEKAL